MPPVSKVVASLEVTPLRFCRICGLKACTKEALEKFKKTEHRKFGRDNYCKKCNSKGLILPEKPYLRKCRICGLEAHTIEELKLFRTDKRNRYGKQNCCVECSHPPRKPPKPFDLYHVTEKKRREFFLNLWEKPYICYYCKKEITSITGGTNKSYLVIHSIDGNHDNWEISNKTPIHSGCHTKLHHIGKKHTLETRLNMGRSRKGKNFTEEHKRKIALSKLGSKNPNWKGDDATEKQKRNRKKLEDY